VAPLLLLLALQTNPVILRAVYAEALAADQRTLGSEDPRVLADAASLASVLPATEALTLWKRAAVSPDDAVAARSLGTLGEFREEAGDRTGAADLYRQALAREELATGKSSGRVAVRLNALALVTDPPAAIPLLERALAIDRRIWGERHTETAATEVNLSGELLAAGRTPDAVRLGSAALAAFEAALGPDHPRTAAAASTLADALRAKRDFAGAEKLYRRALAIDERAFGPSHAETLADIRNLVDLLRAQHRTDEADELEKRLLLP